jgi:NADPH:quinone reductase-like Zn-dependent oxidoreductase
MKMLAQKLKHGKVEISEAPMPKVGPESVLIRNHFSLISAGTEGSTVNGCARKVI